MGHLAYEGIGLFGFCTTGKNTMGLLLNTMTNDEPPDTRKKRERFAAHLGNEGQLRQFQRDAA
jgi:hypothetical protein